jgi:hypothetical protein
MLPIPREIHVKALHQVANANQRAKDLGRGIIHLDDWLVTIAASAGLCFYCRRNIGMLYLHMDHRVPFCRGGENARKNLVACCKSCNSKKAHRTAFEYVQRMRVSLASAPMQRTPPDGYIGTEEAANELCMTGRAFWALCRQLGVRVRSLPYREEPPGRRHCVANDDLDRIRQHKDAETEARREQMWRR